MKTIAGRAVPTDRGSLASCGPTNVSDRATIPIAHHGIRKDSPSRQRMQAKKTQLKNQKTVKGVVIYEPPRRIPGARLKEEVKVARKSHQGNHQH